ncbi:MAG: DNA repair protein RecO [Phormidesmis sp.]
MTQRSYKATGINLKAIAMGESDRLVTVLTKEKGLIRAIAPGARKHKSRLAGRSGLFVVNELLFAKGKSIDKLVQAETLQSFPGLSSNLAKLTASQYLAEIVLYQALSGQPQSELYYLLIEHLTRIETASQSNLLPCLAQATFHLLALAGVAPEVFRCCLSRSPLTIDLSNPNWRVGFSVSSGGAIAASEIAALERDRLKQLERQEEDRLARLGQSTVGKKRVGIGVKRRVTQEIARDLGIIGYLSAAELALMQQLSKPDLVMSTPTVLPTTSSTSALSSHLGSQSGTIRRTDLASLESGPHLMWRHIEKFLRHYTQYQFERPIRSAALIDTCFTLPTHAAPV